MILVVHSSPKKQGNLERLVALTAQSSGHDYDMIRLADLTIHPCTGCVQCARSKRCVQGDDMHAVYPRLEQIDGLILGGVNYNGRVNSLAHVFMERLFPLYHQTPTLRNLPVAIVAVGGEAPEKAAEDMAGYLKNIYFCNVVGAALFLSDTPPCFSCGLGPKCPVGIPALTWKDKDLQSFTRVRKEMFLRFEDNPDVVLAARRLGETLATSIAGEWGRPRSGGGFYLPSSG